MEDNSWREYLRRHLSEEEFQESQRESAKQVLEAFLPEHEQWYGELVREGIIPVEMLDALFDSSRDPLDRQATHYRIFDMVKEYFAREKEKRTLTGMVKKLLSDFELIKAQVQSNKAASTLPTYLLEVGQSISKHEMLKCNQWLIVEYFDKGRSLKELVNEWRRIREEKDLKHPVVNPLASMTTVISEEKRRRKDRN